MVIWALESEQTWLQSQPCRAEQLEAPYTAGGTTTLQTSVVVFYMTLTI